MIGIPEQSQIRERTIYGIMIFTVCFAAVYFYFCKPLFESPDDMMMIRILTGQYGAEFSGNPIFMSPVMGKMIAFLYQVLPLYPWYSAILYSFLFIGLLLGTKLIVDVIDNKILLWMCVLGFLSLYMYICVRLNFTSCSLVLWFTAYLYVLIFHMEKRPIGLCDVALSLLLVCSYLTRPDMVELGLIFTTPLIGYMLITRLGKVRLCVVALPLTLVILFTIINPSYQTMQPEGYKILQTNKSQILDTNRGNANNNTKLALDHVGWSEGDYLMFRHWWTYDETIYDSDKEMEFLKINSPYSVGMVSLKYGLRSLPPMSAFLFIILLLGIMLVRFDNPSPYKKSNTLCWSLIGLTIAMICGLACIRLPLRVSVPLLIYVLMLLIILRPSLNVKHKFSVGPRLLTEITLIILALNIITIRFLSEDANKIQNLKNEIKETKETVQILNDSPTYFFNMTPGIENFDGKPISEIKQDWFNEIPGSWLIGTDQYYNYLSKHGHESGRDLIESSINNRNAVFYFYQPPSGGFYNEYFRYVSEHLSAHYGVIGQKLFLNVLADTRHTDKSGNQTGFVFFNLQSEITNGQKSQIQ